MRIKVTTQQVNELRATGMRDADIARKLGVSKSTVSRKPRVTISIGQADIDAKFSDLYRSLREAHERIHMLERVIRDHGIDLDLYDEMPYESALAVTSALRDLEQEKAGDEPGGLPAEPPPSTANETHG